MNKAIYFEVLHYTPENLALLEDSFKLIRVKDPSILDMSLLKDVSALFAPLGYFFGKEFFDQSPNLRVIASNTTGIPHIDEKAAIQRDIKIISLRDEKKFLQSITPTAELTLGLIICIARNVVPARQSILEGRWSRWDFGGDAMLSRMCLGIVGLGRLGSMVARYASVLGMRVIYYDPFVNASPDAGYERMGTLEELTRTAHIVTVHVPSTSANRHMFNRDVFSQFRKGAYFVNTARGELVNSEALIDALDRRILRGAALDVVDSEFETDFARRVLDHPLVKYARSHSNLIITPHIAGSTKDAWHLTQRFVIEKTINYFLEKERNVAS